MKNFKQCMIIMVLFFIAALAFLEVDRRCSDMYGMRGKIVDRAVNAVNIVVE